jgi:DNA polymerase-3 subunit alpha
MVLSGNLYGEIGKILNLGENQAEEALVWWNNNLIFISKSYNQEDENRVNKTLIEFAQKTRG